MHIVKVRARISAMAWDLSGPCASFFPSLLKFFPRWFRLILQDPEGWEDSIYTKHFCWWADAYATAFTRCLFCIAPSGMRVWATVSQNPEFASSGMSSTFLATGPTQQSPAPSIFAQPSNPFGSGIDNNQRQSGSRKTKKKYWANDGQKTLLTTDTSISWDWVRLCSHACRHAWADHVRCCCTVNVADYLFGMIPTLAICWVFVLKLPITDGWQCNELGDLYTYRCGLSFRKHSKTIREINFACSISWSAQDRKKHIIGAGDKKQEQPRHVDYSPETRPHWLRPQEYIECASIMCRHHIQARWKSYTKKKICIYFWLHLTIAYVRRIIAFWGRVEIGRKQCIFHRGTYISHQNIWGK